MRTTPGAAPARDGLDDRGSALILTLMVMALVTALGTTVMVITINNLQSSWRAQQAGSALNAADAGVAQAMTHLRRSGVRDLCAPPPSAGNDKLRPYCGGNDPWSSGNPMTVTLAGEAGQTYRTWIEVVSRFAGKEPGLYRVHSTGTANGAASRAVTLDVGVTMINVPKGVFARSIGGGGSANVERQSIFSTGCVSRRAQIDMTPGEIDLAYGIPVGVHSSQYITEENVNTPDCSLSGNKLIHRGGTNSNPTARPCNTDYPYDHDRLGGSLSGSPCAGVATSHPAYYGTRDLDGDGTIDVRGSYLEDEAALFQLFGFKKPALTPPEIDRLRTLAQAQGNYFSSTAFTSPDEANAVMFFDLKGLQAGGTVNLNDIQGFGRQPVRSADISACTTRSLVIVIEGGNVTLNSNQQLYASLFLTSPAPYGQVYKANGTANFIGTIYADTVNLVGNLNISTDECFQSNVSPGLLDMRVGAYREIDRDLS